MPDKNLFQQFSEGLANAVADIRQKLVEEPWFGRAAPGPNEHESAPHWPEAREPQTFGSHTHTMEPAPEIDRDR